MRLNFTDNENTILDTLFEISNERTFNLSLLKKEINDEMSEKEFNIAYESLEYAHLIA